MIKKKKKTCFAVSCFVSVFTVLCFQQLKLKYYQLMIELDEHEGSYLAICKHYKAVYETPEIRENPDKLKEVWILIALLKRVTFVCLWHWFLCLLHVPTTLPVLKYWKYSRLSLSRSRRDPHKHLEIPVLRHIRCAELRKIPNEQPNFTNEHVI